MIDDSFRGINWSRGYTTRLSILCSFPADGTCAPIPVQRQMVAVADQTGAAEHTRTKRAPILKAALLGAGALGVGALGVGALGAGVLGAGALGAGVLGASALGGAA